MVTTDATTPPPTDRAKAMKAATHAVVKAEAKVEKNRSELAEAEAQVKSLKTAARAMFGE